MMRITTWRQNVPPPEGTSPGAAIAAFNEAAAALKKVPGNGDVYWGFGGGGIVTVAFPSSYAAADAVLKDPGVQAAVAKIFLLGISITEDVFALAPEQAMPFLPPQ
jgi:carbamate kinase